MRPDNEPTPQGEPRMIMNKPDYVKGKGHTVVVDGITAADGESNE